MKEIEDYLHLYLGSNCPVSGVWGIGRLVGIDWDSGWCMVEWRKNFLPGDEDGHQHRKETEIKHVKPILRQLSDMSEEEKMDLHWKNQSPEQLRWMKEDNYAIKCSEFLYLLSKHFDLFNLIPAGLAIDSTKIKINE